MAISHPLCLLKIWSWSINDNKYVLNRVNIALRRCSIIDVPVLQIMLLYSSNGRLAMNRQLYSLDIILRGDMMSVYDDGSIK